METLTTVADAILNDKQDYAIREIQLTPEKAERPVLDNITNKNVFVSPEYQSSLSALFNGKITSKTKSILKTPGKRRKSSLKYGDENKAPSPKTPKNSKAFPKLRDSPMTPLSNLKMLTRVASMEEPITSKKNLYMPEVPNPKFGLRRCISECSNAVADVPSESTNLTKLKRHSTSSDFDDIEASEGNSDGYVMTASRRDKSLGVLCERFLDHFPMEVSCLETPRRLVIDDVASVLRTERRRVYDIVNILECLNMASRVQKNMYQWMGKQHLETTLSKLKGLGEEMGLNFPLNSFPTQSIKDKVFSTPGGSSGDRADIKEKSIGIICQKFLMLFLSSRYPHVIQMDSAVFVLLGQEGDDLEKLRSRGRRIYDIANVLIALKLIQRLPRCKAFMYVGPKVEAARGEVSCPPKLKFRHSLLPPPSLVVAPAKGLAASFDDAVTPLDNEERKKGPVDASKSRAKRNCLVGRTKSEESKLQLKVTTPSSKRHPSLQDICEVAELEREKLEVEPLEEKPKPQTNNSYIPEAIKWRFGNSFRFPFISTPRIALNFQNSPGQRPPIFTNQPPNVPSAGYSKVIVKPPFILRKVNIPANCVQKDGTPIAKPISTIQNQVIGNIGQSLDSSNKSFRIYNHKSKQFRTLSLPDVSNATLQSQPKEEHVSNVSLGTATAKVFTKSLSQMNVPCINLNTLSRSHYKTVYGNTSEMPKQNLTATKEGSYHFVINSKPDSQAEIGKAPTQPTFVKMFQISPDNSSTDSELESIFGDSFKFTRPKNVVTKLS